MKFAVDSRPVDFGISQRVDCSDGTLSTGRRQGIHALSRTRCASSCRLLPWSASLVDPNASEARAVMVAWFGWLRSRLATGAPLRQASPLPLAGALIADADGRLLLVHRNTPEMTWWEVPGGKVEAGEDPWQAAQREA